MKDLHAIVEQLDTRLQRVTTQVIRYIRDCPAEVTLQQAFLLQQIQLQGACTASTIGELLGITSGPVTSITKRLISRGLVARRQDALDRRVMWFTLTDDGERVLHTFVKLRREKWRQLFELVGEEKASKLLDIVKDIEQELDKLR